MTRETTIVHALVDHLKQLVHLPEKLTRLPQQGLEPGRVDACQHRLAGPQPAVLGQPVEAHRNFSLRAANALIWSSSQPWRKRSIFVSP